MKFMSKETANDVLDIQQPHVTDALGRYCKGNAFSSRRENDVIDTRN